MFNWLKDSRRKRLTLAPFPPEWKELVLRNVAPYRLLDHEQRTRLQDLIKVFVAEKHWEGAGGLVLTDEIRVTIAAQACLLLLGLSHDFYRNVASIIIYPTTVLVPQRRPGFFEQTRAPLKPETPILGQAFQQGPVIITWDAVLQACRHPQLGHNVVYHEFAHKLDMLDGLADGTPPLRDRAEYRDWIETCSREYLRLKQAAESGMETFLDAYGATSEAEFFAVATEEFFDRPHRLHAVAPDLFRVLRQYYRQDPLEREQRGVTELAGNR